MTEELTPQNHPDLASTMRYLEFLRTHRTGWDPPFHEAMLKLMCHVSWEPIPSRKVDGHLQFMYSRRDPNDLAYPPDPTYGAPYYFGGTYNRGEPMWAGLGRVNAKEFKVGRLTDPRFLGCINWFNEDRGPDVGCIFLCGYEGETPQDAIWLPFEQLPPHMMESHRILASRVIAHIQAGCPGTLWIEDPRVRRVA